jgi:hypothetical protein
MGANVSSESTDKLNKSVNKTINDFSTTIENSVSGKAISVQKMNVYFDGVECDELNINQISSVKLSIINQNQSALATAIKDTFKNNISDLTKSVTEQSNEDLSLGQANVSDKTTKIQSIIENDVHNIVSNTLKNSFETTSSSDQTLSIPLRNTRVKGKCTFTQSSIVENISQNIVKNVLDNIAEKLSDNTIKGESDNKNSQKNAGIDVMSPFKMLAIFGGVAGLIILLVILYMIFGRKSDDGDDDEE